MELAPSILNANLLEIRQILINLNKLKINFLHLDIMDGNFVPNLSFGYNVIKPIKTIFKGKLISHLMIKNPDKYINNFASEGSDYISFHIEVTGNKTIELINKVKDNKKKVGLVLNPDTSLKKVNKFLDKINLITIMSVYPGFGGQKFIESTYDKIKQLDLIRKKEKFKFLIEVDGGIIKEIIPELKKLFVDILVIGNYIFKNKNYTEKILEIKNIL